MIFNMSNAPKNAQYTRFYNSSSTPLTSLIINNVEIPGGIVKGFTLVLDDFFLFEDNKIVFAWANPYDEALTNDFVIGYFESVSIPGDGIGRISTKTYGNPSYKFEYDIAAKTLTLNPPAGYTFGQGNYALLIW